MTKLSKNIARSRVNMKICITGLRYFGNIFANQLKNKNINADFIEMKLLNNKVRKIIMDSNIVYFLFSPFTSLRGLLSVIIIKFLFKKKIAIMWVGTDVLLTSRGIYMIYTKIGLKFVDINISTTRWMFKELNQMGIKNITIQVPFLCKNLSHCKLPKIFTVLIYLPKNAYNFYRGYLCEKIMDYFKHVSFLVVGHNGKGLKKRKNVKYLGWINNMNEIYCKSTVLLRIPLHDALSCMVSEALSLGRYVIWIYPLKGCFYAKKYDDIIYYLNKLLNMPDLKLNEEGFYFFNHYNNKKNSSLEKIIRIYEILSYKIY